MPDGLAFASPIITPAPHGLSTHFRHALVHACKSTISQSMAALHSRVAERTMHEVTSSVIHSDVSAAGSQGTKLGGQCHTCGTTAHVTECALMER
jgi:hypothetical protein